MEDSKEGKSHDDASQASSTKGDFPLCTNGVHIKCQGVTEGCCGDCPDTGHDIAEPYPKASVQPVSMQR